jgi:hypothetical protein
MSSRHQAGLYPWGNHLNAWRPAHAAGRMIATYDHDVTTENRATGCPWPIVVRGPEAHAVRGGRAMARLGETTSLTVGPCFSMRLAADGDNVLVGDDTPGGASASEAKGLNRAVSDMVYLADALRASDESRVDVGVCDPAMGVLLRTWRSGGASHTSRSTRRTPTSTSTDPGQPPPAGSRHRRSRRCAQARSIPSW